MKISLIIPVYNAENTLPALFEALRAQQFRDFEVLFSDDASTDASPALLHRFAAESGIPCRILREEVNRGAAAARNRALDTARGEFLTFADADDLPASDWLEKATLALQSHPDADIVGWDWTLGLSRDGRYMRQPDYSTPQEAFRSLTGGLMRWNLWLFMVRRSLLEKNGLRFVDGADMGEDMGLILRCFLRAGTVVQLHESLYRYNGVSNSSISREFAPAKRLQVEQNLRLVGELFAPSDWASILPEAMDELKLYLTRPRLIGLDANHYETWYHWFPEVNALARKGAAGPLHTRILQKMAAGKHWGLVKLYYLLVHKLMYGILYR